MSWEDMGGNSRQTDDDDAALDGVQCMWRDGGDGRDTCGDSAVESGSDDKG